MNDPIIVRRARVSDALKLSILCKTVYIQTYGTEGVSDEFANFIEVRFAPSNLERTIVTNANSLAVAEFNGNLVGVVEIAYGNSCPIGNIVAPELNKLYVLDWFCGKGVGYKLLKMSETMVREQGASQMWLWVLSSNQRAISFYERQNYEWIGNASFQMEKNKYDNKVMVKQLV